MFLLDFKFAAAPTTSKLLFLQTYWRISVKGDFYFFFFLHDDNISDNSFGIDAQSW